ncbi:hypothetical protein H1D32_16280 [Anaerobacillus sp. CMMVII]|uniref:hypothetical protein n=1 Tax=Anaerobacillus sp. CMMVII TaxID=2755588 RepID=UPI0021B70E25|nr:hypothetical protein [Anaerobacillus sp. CMMVII]MCT8139122.1 hypothetical protein [Anaerobacillus sp. CMMVII]
MTNEYQTLLNGMFICGLKSVESVIENEEIDIVLDLRAEAQGDSDYGSVKRLRVPLEDGISNQTQLLQQGIQHAVNAYTEGKKVVLH